MTSLFSRVRELFLVASGVATMAACGVSTEEPTTGEIELHSEPVFDDPACQPDPSLPPVCERIECRYQSPCSDPGDEELSESGDSGGGGSPTSALWEECLYGQPTPITRVETHAIALDHTGTLEGSGAPLDSGETAPGEPPEPPAEEWVLCDEYSDDPFIQDNPRPALAKRPKESKCVVTSASGTVFPGTYSDTGTSNYSKSVANGKIAKGTSEWWQTSGGTTWKWWRGLGWAKRLLFAGFLKNSKVGVKCFAKKVGTDMSCVGERNINDYYSHWGLAYNDWPAIDGTLYWLGSDSAFKDPGVPLSSDVEVGVAAGIAVDVVNIALGTIGFTAKGATPTWSVTNKRNYLAYHRMTVHCDWEDGRPPGQAKVSPVDAETGAAVEDDGGAGSNSPPGGSP